LLHALAAALLMSEPIPTPNITWEAPPECPTQAQVQAWLVELLPATQTDRVSIEGAATVTPDAYGGFQLELSVVSPGGRDVRTLHDRNCATLARASGIVLAVATDPIGVADILDEASDPADARMPEPPPEHVPAPTSPRAAGADASPASPSPPSQPRPSRWQAAARTQGFAGFGVLPRGDFGFGLALAALGPSCRIELQLVHGLRTSARYEAFPDVGADLQLWASNVRGCWVPAFRAFEFPLCGGVEAGAVAGEGVGVGVTRARRGPWAAVLAGAAFVWRAHAQVALWSGIDGHVAVARPAFFIRGSAAELYRSRPGGFRGVLGIEIRVP
jgi:hypothetical protein